MISEIEIQKIDSKLQSYFKAMFPTHSFFFTTSATSALELASFALNLKKGDEVIMPSFNYVGVAQAFVKNGVSICLIDSEENSLNIDLNLVEKAITSRTKALLIMHYGGVACDIKKAIHLCKKHNLYLIEDNSQGIFSKYKNEYLGSFGDMACISFENQKNVSVGEGGVLVVKKKYENKVKPFYNVGTDRALLNDNIKSFYEWTTVSGKFYMSKYLKSKLLDNLQGSQQLLLERKKKWKYCYDTLINTPIVKCLELKNKEIEHNAHIFWLKLKDQQTAENCRGFMLEKGVELKRHFYPLHLSKYAQSTQIPFYKSKNSCLNTIFYTLLRIPIDNNQSMEDFKKMINELSYFFENIS